MRDLKFKILNLFLVIFFPFSLLRFAATIFYGWNRFGGEFYATFPFCLFLKNYNPSLYISLKNYNWGGGPSFTTTWFYGPIHHLWAFPLTLFFHSMEPLFQFLLIFYASLIIFCMILIFNSIKKDNNILFIIAYFTLILGSFGFNENLMQRNIELLEFFLIGAAYLLLQKKRDYAGGSLLCFAAMAKVLPFMFLPYLLIKKRFKAVAGFLITFIMIVIITQATLRWQNWDMLDSNVTKFFGVPSAEIFLGNNSFQPIRRASCSLASAVLLFFGKIDFSKIDISNVPLATYCIDNFFIPNLIYLLLAFLIAASTFYLFYRTGKKADLFQEFSIVCLLMLLVPQHCNPHYYIFTIFAGISILKAFSYDFDRYKVSSFFMILLFFCYIVSLLLIGNFVPFQLYERALPLKVAVFHYFVVYNLFVFGTLILWAIIMWFYYMNYKIDKRMLSKNHAG